MAAKLDEFNTAVRLHRAIVMVVKRQLNKLRPLPRYGVVTGAVNPATQQVLVRIGRDSSDTPVTCSPFLTPKLGSDVRVEGSDSDLVVTMVMRGGLEAPVSTL